MTSADFFYGLVAGLAVAGVAYGGLRWYFANLLRRQAGTPAPGDRPKGASAPPAPSPPPIRPRIAAPTAVPEPGPDGASVAPSATVSIESSVADASAAAFVPAEELAGLRLSQRVLQHLARNGGSVLGDSVTQRGIQSSLGVTQGALSSVLRRLEDGGAIASEKAHVQGRDRRVKVYVLTPRGRSLVSQGINPNVRARSVEPPAAAGPSAAPTT
ncbi:MAG: helix-turn-helix transcriptional regulator [Thermoplasmata archaeon]|nr:helix-turn-helix transcriptional regulator [Thermoplasmata archaeon]